MSNPIVVHAKRGTETGSTYAGLLIQGVFIDISDDAKARETAQLWIDNGYAVVLWVGNYEAFRAQAQS